MAFRGEEKGERKKPETPDPFLLMILEVLLTPSPYNNGKHVQI